MLILAGIAMNWLLGGSEGLLIGGSGGFIIVTCGCVEPWARIRWVWMIVWPMLLLPLGLGLGFVLMRLWPGSAPASSVIEVALGGPALLWCAYVCVSALIWNFRLWRRPRAAH